MNSLRQPPPEPKIRTPRAHLPHSLTARDLTALGESYDALPGTIDAFADSWRPRNPYETSLVHTLAALSIRLDRLARMETGLLDSNIPLITAEDSLEAGNCALANSFSYGQRHFNAFSRYEANLSRAYDRTLKQLLAVRNLPVPPRLNSPAGETFDKTNPSSVENKAPRSARKPKSPLRPAAAPSPRPAPAPSISPSQQPTPKSGKGATTAALSPIRPGATKPDPPSTGPASSNPKTPWSPRTAPTPAASGPKTISGGGKSIPRSSPVRKVAYREERPMANPVKKWLSLCGSSSA